MNPTEPAATTGRVARLLTPLLAAGSAAYRLLPLKLQNFTPVGGAALYAARLPLGPALAWTFAAMLVSDVVLWLVDSRYPMFVTPVYLSFAAYVLLGRWLLRGTDSPFRVGAVSMLASCQFFLVTNAACWWAFSDYEHTLSGLARCYVAGVPFFAGTLVGDLVFSVAVFSLAAAAERRAAPSGGRVVKFAVVYEYPPDPERVQAARPAHRQYLTQLLERGQLVCAGPFPDGTGALIVYEAPDAAAVEPLITSDPFHAAGVFLKWTVKPWNPVFANRDLLPG